MTRRTLQLMRAAGISLVDDRGQTLSVMASSWRAGGVRSAVEAGVGEAAIMELGRWHSSAWTHYILFFSARPSSSKRADVAARKQ